jgi:hypothetical protein
MGLLTIKGKAKNSTEKVGGLHDGCELHQNMRWRSAPRNREKK